MHGVLLPPSSNLQLSQWSKQPELLQALQLARLMLQQPQADRPEAHVGLAQLTIQAAYGAMAVSEQAVVAALDALSFLHSPGLEQEAVVLYCELISHRGSWRVNAAGCRALAESSAAATTTLLSPGAPQSLQRCAGRAGGGALLTPACACMSRRVPPCLTVHTRLPCTLQECERHHADGARQEGQRAAVPLHRRRAQWHGAGCVPCETDMWLSLL